MRISDWSSDVCSSDLNNGRQCSAPRNIGTMPFDHLSPVLADALIARGYAALTPVQAQVVEAEAKGRDLLVSAQTRTEERSVGKACVCTCIYRWSQYQ